MESRLGRIMSNKLTRRTFLGVLGATLITPSEATAQLIDPRPPGGVEKPKPKPRPVFSPFSPTVSGVVTSFEYLEQCDYGNDIDVGVVSYYSEADCLGCSADKVMANGERFNENDLTMANNRLPLNSKVKVTNLNENLSTVARVTDRHGVPSRIADLSKRLYERIKARTDDSQIRIQTIFCR